MEGIAVFMSIASLAISLIWLAVAFRALRVLEMVAGSVVAHLRQRKEP